MIEFRCWYCNRLHERPTTQIGRQFFCSCEYPLRVPGRSGGPCRVNTFSDFLITTLVYGGGGGLFGLGVSVVFLSRLFSRFTYSFSFAWVLFLTPPLLGLTIGAVFGERGINWIGRLLRSDEDLRR